MPFLVVFGDEIPLPSRLKKIIKMKYKVLLGLALMCSMFTASAQKTEPLFEIKAGDAIANTKFLIQASTGELLTGNDLKLMAINPDTKTLIWESKEFLGLNEEDIEVLEGTPFIKIERQKTLALSKNKNVFIIQARDGKVVYDSKEEGIKVRNTMVIQDLNGLLIEYVKDGFLSVGFIDFVQAKMIWTQSLTKEKTGGFGIGALTRAVKSRLSAGAFTVAPQVDASGTLLLAYKKELFAINKAGALAWKKEFDEVVSDAYLTTNRKALIVGYKKYVDKIATETGASELKEAIKMRDDLNGMMPMGNDYILYNEAGINIMDASGNMKWAKDVKLGNIVEVNFNDKGILAVDGKEKEKTIYHWVSFEGKEIWDESVDGTNILAQPTDKGVMYITAERANILTYEKGKDVWNKDIKIKGVPFFGMDKENRVVYAYAKGKLHAFNFTDVSYKLVAEDIELKKWDDEKEPAKIEPRENGAKVLIYAAQSVALVNTADGKVQYNEYFKEIGSSRKKLLKFIGNAASIAGAAMDVSAISKGNFTASQTVDANGKPVANSTTINANGHGTAVGSAGDDLVAAASARYTATQATKDNLYILSQMPEGNGLLVWNKDKGLTTNKITFSDLTPQYVVDEAKDMLYVVVGNTIKAYALNK